MAAVNDYNLDFTTVNPIPAGGFIRVIFPTDQVVVPTLGPNCEVNYIFTNLSCSIVYQPSGFIWVDIVSPCAPSACSANYAV